MIAVADRKVRFFVFIVLSNILEFILIINRQIDMFPSDLGN